VEKNLMFTHLSKFKAVAVAAAAVFSMGSASAATTTYIDNFESYTNGAFAGSPTLDPNGFGTWLSALTGGSINVIDDPAPYAPGGDNDSLRFNGSGALTYTFTLASDSVVDVWFHEGANSSNAVSLTLNGNTIASNTGSIGGFSLFNPAGTYSLAAGTHAFAFANTTGTFYLDNFSVSVTTAPVPEPETYAMMLAGLGALGFMARRRRAS
jgi:hypothetical protein